MDVVKLFEDFNYAAVLLGVAMLAPGFLLLFARSRYVTGRMSAVSSATIEFVLASSIYYAIAAPIFFYFDVYNWISVEILVFWGPLVLGAFFGGLTQWKWAKSASGFFGLNSVTPHPTGWDKAFGSLKGDVWLIIHTIDLGILYGRFGQESNASNDLNKRDIFIEELRDENFAEVGEADEVRGMWIREDQIIAIEVANDRRNDTDE
jgi:vacuolar-type H+-ATPase subunit I/STV1